MISPLHPLKERNLAITNPPFFLLPSSCSLLPIDLSSFSDAQPTEPPRCPISSIVVFSLVNTSAVLKRQSLQILRTFLFNLNQSYKSITFRKRPFCDKVHTHSDLVSFKYRLLAGLRILYCFERSLARSVLFPGDSINGVVRGQSVSHGI